MKLSQKYRKICLDTFPFPRLGEGLGMGAGQLFVFHFPKRFKLGMLQESRMRHVPADQVTVVSVKKAQLEKIMTDEFVTGTEQYG